MEFTEGLVEGHHLILSRRPNCEKACNYKNVAPSQQKRFDTFFGYNDIWLIFLGMMY